MCHRFDVRSTVDDSTMPGAHVRKWGHVETRTVADLARVFFTQNNRPATEKELFEFISPLRKVAKESIRVELKRNHHFLRVAPRTWAIRAGPGQM